MESKCTTCWVGFRTVRGVPLGFGDKARDDDRLPLVLRAVAVALGGRSGARVAHLREGELAHVAHDLGRRLARLAKGKVDPLAAARVTKLGREHGGHAEGGLVTHARGRAGKKEDVQVVHGGVVQRRPPQYVAARRAWSGRSASRAASKSARRRGRGWRPRRAGSGAARTRRPQSTFSPLWPRTRQSNRRTRCTRCTCAR